MRGLTLLRHLAPFVVAVTTVAVAVFMQAAPAAIARAAAPIHWAGNWAASPTDSLTPIDAPGSPCRWLLTDQTL